MRFNCLLLVPCVLALAACGGGGSSNDDGNPANVFNITSTALISGVVGVPYVYQLQTQHGSGTVNFAWNAGFTPPAWLTLSTTGLLSGTPIAVGNFDLEIRATDSGMIPVSALKTLPLEVLAAPQIITTTLARGIKGQPFTESLTFTAPTGVNPEFDTTSLLPAGITLTAAGNLAGTPTETGLFEIEVELLVGTAVVDTRVLDLVVYESIPFTYAQDSLENNDTTGTGTQLFAGNTPPGRMTMADRHVQGAPLTVNSDVNITKPDPSDFFRFSIGTVGTIKVEVFFRAFVGDVDAYLWFYSGPPTHAVSIVARSEGGADDETITYHNAQLSGGLGAGFYYLELRAPADVPAALFNRNSYSFRITFNDLTVVTQQLEADSASGPLNAQVVALNQGAAPGAPQFSIVSGTLPAGVTFTQDGRFTGTPTEFGMRDFVVRVRDGALSVDRAIRVRFFDSAAGDFWQVKGERRLYNGTTNPVYETFGEAAVVAPHPDYPAEGAIYVLGGRTDVTLDGVRVFHTDRAGIPAARQFKFEDIGKPMPHARRYHGAVFVQHSYGGYIYVAGGEIGAPTAAGHSVGDFFYGVERLQVADAAGVALPHPLASSWEVLADMPKLEGSLNIKGWAEFGLVARDAAADTDDRLYVVAGKYHIEDSVGAGTYSMKFHNAVLMLACPTTAVGTGVWHRKTDVNPYTPVRFPAVAMINDRIYIVAGRPGTAGQTGSGMPPVSSIQMIQPDPTATNPSLATANATQFPTLTENVYFPMYGVIGNSLYVWCGWDANVQGTRRLHRFDPNLGTGIGGTVTRLCDADWPTGFGAGIAHDGKLWVFSGIGHDGGSLPLNLRYTP